MNTVEEYLDRVRQLFQNISDAQADATIKILLRGWYSATTIPLTIRRSPRIGTQA